MFSSRKILLIEELKLSTTLKCAVNKKHFYVILQTFMGQFASQILVLLTNAACFLALSNVSLNGTRSHAPVLVHTVYSAQCTLCTVECTGMLHDCALIPPVHLMSMSLHLQVCTVHLEPVISPASAPNLYSCALTLYCCAPTLYSCAPTMYSYAPTLYSCAPTFYSCAPTLHFTTLHCTQLHYTGALSYAVECNVFQTGHLPL